MHLGFQTTPIRKCASMFKKACTSLVKQHRVFMQPGLAFEQEGRELLDFWGGFGFRGQELSCTVVFWRRVQLVEAVGEAQLYTNAMH